MHQHVQMASPGYPLKFTSQGPPMLLTGLGKCILLDGDSGCSWNGTLVNCTQLFFMTNLDLGSSNWATHPLPGKAPNQSILWWNQCRYFLAVVMTSVCASVGAEVILWRLAPAAHFTLSWPNLQVLLASSPLLSVGLLRPCLMDCSHNQKLQFWLVSTSSPAYHSRGNNIQE